MMVELHERFPRLLAPTLRKLCEQLLARRAPLLIHCTAGKDRTGFTVAVLLYALGIPRELIYADYLASRNWAGAKKHRPALARRLAPVIPAAAMDTVLDPILDVRERYLDAALAAVAAEFGSVERYFEHATGLDRREIDHLRDLALV